MSKLLTRDWILKVAERPPGYATIYDFCEAVRKGTPPNPDVLEKIANAFEPLIDEPDLEIGQWKFSKQLQLIDKQGRPEPNESEVSQRIIAGWEYRVLRQSKLKRRKLSENRASMKIAHEYGVSQSTIRRWAKDYREDIEAFAEVVEGAEKRWRKKHY